MTPNSVSNQQSIGAVHTGCGNCPPKPEHLPMGDVSLHPGFGSWECSRDDETVLYDVHGEGATAFTTQDCEDAAAGDPDHDWRITVNGPLGGVVYQRHGEGEWVAIERLDGFA